MSSEKSSFQFCNEIKIYTGNPKRGKSWCLLCESMETIMQKYSRKLAPDTSRQYWIFAGEWGWKRKKMKKALPSLHKLSRRSIKNGPSKRKSLQNLSRRRSIKNGPRKRKSLQNLSRRRVENGPRKRRSCSKMHFWLTVKTGIKSVKELVEANLE